ncbi:MAG: hypothetical protein BroJett030_27140 [Alphaproteobacteria bacterium]|nr:MAG: hypothetical protein BroJett030_27140 [Alphaproteobacteria bacterium]
MKFWATALVRQCTRTPPARSAAIAASASSRVSVHAPDTIALLATPGMSAASIPLRERLSEKDRTGLIPYAGMTRIRFKELA